MTFFAKNKSIWKLKKILMLFGMLKLNLKNKIKSLHTKINVMKNTLCIDHIHYSLVDDCDKLNIRVQVHESFIFSN